LSETVDEMFEAAERVGREKAATEPRARAVRHDRKTKRVLVELKHGCTFAFPARLAEGLEHASDADLASDEILGPGNGLHWESLDVDLTIPGLLAGLFGTKAYMDRTRSVRCWPADVSAQAGNRSMERTEGRPRESVGWAQMRRS
jgi:hypothetical protein